MTFCPRPGAARNAIEIAERRKMMALATSDFLAMHDLCLDLRGLDIHAELSGTKSPVNAKRRCHPLLQLFLETMAKYRSEEDPAAQANYLGTAIRLMQDMSTRVHKAAGDITRTSIEVLKMRHKGIKASDTPSQTVKAAGSIDDRLLDMARRAGVDVEELEAAMRSSDPAEVDAEVVEDDDAEA